MLFSGWVLQKVLLNAFLLGFMIGQMLLRFFAFSVPSCIVVNQERSLQSKK